jgi:hypothetical protein
MVSVDRRRTKALSHGPLALSLWVAAIQSWVAKAAKERISGLFVHQRQSEPLYERHRRSTDFIGLPRSLLRAPGDASNPVRQTHFGVLIGSSLFAGNQNSLGQFRHAFRLASINVALPNE